MGMFQKLTNAQIESSKEITKNFRDLHKETLERENAMKEDLKKTQEVLHIMQGSIEETLTSHVGEIDAQKSIFLWCKKKFPRCAVILPKPSTFWPKK